MSQAVVIVPVAMRRRREEGRGNLVWCLGLPFLDDWSHVGDRLLWSRDFKAKDLPLEP